MENSTLSKCLSTYSPISLDEMESVKLMNRVDTKYVCHESQLPAILAQAAENYRVQEVAGKRVATYDTVYYDTDGLEMYLRHHDQQLTRRKVRIRTYLDTGAEFLEIKKKNNRGRTKKKRIEVNGDAALNDANGVMVTECKANELRRLRVRSGIYIIRYGNGKTRKTLITA